MITSSILATLALAGEVTFRASLAYNGTQSNSPCSVGCVSPDGRLIGINTIANLDGRNDSNPRSDAFARDLLTGRIERISLAQDGSLGNDGSYLNGFSTDNRYAVFVSGATNLVGGDSNGTSDIFVRDRLLGTTELISLTHDGQIANGGSEIPSISADGRFVAFDSIATNLVPSDTNGKSDIFVRDRWLGTTTRVSVSSSGEQADRDSWGATVSADGKYVVFQSYARNLIPDDTNRLLDVYLHNMQTAETERISVASDGTEGNGESRVVFGGQVISNDARYVSFGSDSSNFADGDTNRVVDGFVRDRWLGTTTRVSVRSDGGQANHGGGSGSITADGRYVIVVSQSTNLTDDGDVNDRLLDVFMHDMWTGETWRISNNTNGEQGNAQSEQAVMSANGMIVAFASNATNLAPNDTNGFMDIFVHINSRLRR